MKKDDVDSMLAGMDVPDPKGIGHQQALKIPLLSYRKSSKAGLWLLLLPAMVAVTVFLRRDIGVRLTVLDAIKRAITAVDGNPVLSYLIPLVVVGLPLTAMAVNILSICHFSRERGTGELLITVKPRVRNLVLIVLSFVLLCFFFLPDTFTS